MMSSTIPSAKYSCSGSPLIFVKGSTANCFVIVTHAVYEWHGMPRASQSLSREAAPLDQRGRASLFVNLAGHEMTLLVEMIVNLSMN